MHLKLSIGYRAMACFDMVLNVLAAGLTCCREFPVVSGPEWRLGLYKHSSFLTKTLFTLVSPIDQNEFDGEFGLYELFMLACRKISDRLAYEYYDVQFSMPSFLLSRKF